MRVTCPHCGQKGRITSTNSLNQKKTIYDLYCSCTSLECGASFVFSLAYARTLTPPQKTPLQIASEMVKHLTDAEKTALEKTVFR